jgi:hypothetical protein
MGWPAECHLRALVALAVIKALAGWGPERSDRTAPRARACPRLPSCWRWANFRGTKMELRSELRARLTNTIGDLDAR